MPAIPEFVLRKLFVPGSLQMAPGGFTFQMNNTFAPVTILALSVGSDGAPCLPERIEIQLSGQPPIIAANITADQPFAMPVNEIIFLRAQAEMPHKQLTVRVETREAGPLAFSIPVKDGPPGVNLTAPFIRLGRLTRNAMRAIRVQGDPNHPRIHYAPPVNWMNDPNGLIYRNGMYHLFYQHNPYEAVWGNMHWGHAVSVDLLHWQQRPLALFPDPIGADAGGCFSGCAVEHDGSVSILYTAVYPETQCLATDHSDELNAWQKHPAPVISAPPAGLQLEGFRDPCLWREGQEWRMALGAGIKDVGGAVLLYRSVDLIVWEYLGILYQGDCNQTEPIQTGIMWECPSFFPLGDRWVLILSIFTRAGDAYTICYTGQYQQNQFMPDGPARLLDDGAGGCLYAPQTFLDADGRRVLIAWLREARPVADQRKAGWSGVMSLPRVLTLNPDRRLVQSPHPNVLAALDAVEPHQLTAGQTIEIGRECTAVTLNIPSDSTGWNGLEFNSGQARIGYDPDNRILSVDCTPAGGLRSQVTLADSGTLPLRLTIFAEGSVLEVFAGDLNVISARFYPNHPILITIIGESTGEIRMIR